MITDEQREENNFQAHKLAQQARDIEGVALSQAHEVVVAANAAHELRRRAALLQGMAPYEAIKKANRTMPETLLKALSQAYGVSDV